VNAFGVAAAVTWRRVVESEDRGDRIEEVRRDPHGSNAVSEGPAGIRDRRRELRIERCL
jgi:hypothetical protein